MGRARVGRARVVDDDGSVGDDGIDTGGVDGTGTGACQSSCPAPHMEPPLDSDKKNEEPREGERRRKGACICGCADVRPMWYIASNVHVCALVDNPKLICIGTLLIIKLQFNL